jgi:hypothetical protein
MKVKLAILMIYVLGLVTLAALQKKALADVPPPAAQAPGPLILLDNRPDSQGVVYFAHSDSVDQNGYRRKGHVNLLYPSNVEPDPNEGYYYNFQNAAQASAACAGCHHTRSDKGIPQLWKCASCHKGEGNNEREIAGERLVNRDGDEVHAERAYHDMCIGCHKANYQAKLPKPGPTTCGGCHKREQ